MKRVLIVHGYAHHVWGSEKVALATARAYRSRGFDVEFVLPGRGPFADEVAAAGFRAAMVNTRIPSLRRPGRAVVRPGVFLGYAARRRPALIHATSLGPLPGLLPAARVLGIPVVAQVQTVYGPDEMRRSFMEEADLLLPVSPAVETACLDYLATRPGRRPQVRLLSPCIAGPDDADRRRGLDLRAAWGAAEGTTVIGMVGQLIHRKGVDVFIEALGKLAADNVRIVPVLVGEAPRGHAAYAAELEDLVRRAGLSDRIVRTGFVRDVPAHMAAIDILAVPSRVEGFGLVAGEAQAAGAVPVAARVGGLPHLVEDERSGLLVAPDDPAALAAALGRLVRDPVLRADLAACGLERTRARYSMQAYAEGLARALEAIDGTAAAAAKGFRNVGMNDNRRIGMMKNSRRRWARPGTVAVLAAAAFAAGCNQLATEAPAPVPVDMAEIVVADGFAFEARRSHRIEVDVRNIDGSGYPGVRVQIADASGAVLLDGATNRAGRFAATVVLTTAEPMITVTAPAIGIVVDSRQVNVGDDVTVVEFRVEGSR